MVNELAHISAHAITPDQLLPYVKSIAGLKSQVCGQGILHIGADQGILVVFSQNPPDYQSMVDNATEKALAIPELRRLTVLSAQRPSQAPANAQTQTDWYWGLNLPLASIPAKVANLLRHASKDITITQHTGPDAWSEAHGALVEKFCELKAGVLDQGSLYLFNALKEYVANAADAIVFSAWSKADKSLQGLAIGDYTAFRSAFYMFAFRAQAAPAGTADLLLDHVIREGVERGHAFINLGLGINPGVEFFKKKWGAQKFLTYTETSWDIRRKSPRNWLNKLFHKK